MYDPVVPRVFRYDYTSFNAEMKTLLNLSITHVISTNRTDDTFSNT